MNDMKDYRVRHTAVVGQHILLPHLSPQWCGTGRGEGIFYLRLAGKPRLLITAYASIRLRDVACGSSHIDQHWLERASLEARNRLGSAAVDWGLVGCLLMLQREGCWRRDIGFV